jgi:hypothetical protein
MRFASRLGSFRQRPGGAFVPHITPPVGRRLSSRRKQGADPRGATACTSKVPETDDEHRGVSPTRPWSQRAIGGTRSSLRVQARDHHRKNRQRLPRVPTGVQRVPTRPMEARRSVPRPGVSSKSRLPAKSTQASNFGTKGAWARSVPSAHAEDGGETAILRADAFRMSGKTGEIG